MSKVILFCTVVSFLLSSCAGFLGVVEEVAEEALDCEIEKVEDRRKSTLRNGNHQKASMLERKSRR